MPDDPNRTFWPRYLQTQLPGLGFRSRDPQLPDAGNYANAANTVDLGVKSGAIADPSQLLPNQPKGTLAAGDGPDYARLAQLADSSAMMGGLAAMRPMATKLNMNPQAVGDGPLTAYTRMRNDAEQKMISDKAAREKDNVDQYNKLLLTKKSMQEGFANIDADTTAQRAAGELDTKLAAQKAIAAGHDATSRERGRQLAQMAGNRIAEARRRAYNNPNADAKAAEALKQVQLDKQTLDAVDAAVDEINANPTPYQDEANKTLPGPLAEVVNKVVGMTSTYNRSQAYKALKMHIANLAGGFGDPKRVSMFKNMETQLPDKSDSNLNKLTQLAQIRNALHSSLESKLFEFPEFEARAGGQAARPDLTRAHGDVPMPGKTLPAKGKKSAEDLLKEYAP